MNKIGMDAMREHRRKLRGVGGVWRKIRSCMPAIWIREAGAGYSIKRARIEEDNA